MSEQSNKHHLVILLSTLKMAIATLASRVLGLVREQALAAVFGASGMTDAFLVAYRIPNILRDLFAEGAFSSAFVPTFTKVLQRDPQKARALMWSLLILLLTITGIIGVGIAIFNHELVMLFAPKFADDPHKFAVTAQLIRLMAPFLAMISLAALFMGVLNALKVFFIPSFAPVFFNIVMICSILFLSKYMRSIGSEPIYALGFGVIGGGFLQLLVQLPLILKKGFGPTGPIELWSVESREVISRMGIGTVGIAATQINVLVNTILASATVVGAVSWLVYAFRFFQFPVGILGVSVANSNLVHFSSAWKAGDRDEAKRILISSYNLSLLVVLPAMALLMALSTASVNLVFEHGAFTRHDTLMSSMALRYYLLGLPFYGIYKIFGPVFYAIDRPKIPVAISSISVGLNIVFCVLMVPHFGFWVLALGTSLSMMINTTTQMVILKRVLNLSFVDFISLPVLKYIGAAGALYYVANLLANRYYLLDGQWSTKLGGYLLASVVATATYFLVLLLTGEGRQILKKFTR